MIILMFTWFISFFQTFSGFSALSTCNLEKINNPTVVVPFRRSPLAIAGCLGQNLTKKNQEIHIFALNSISLPHSDANTISLNLKRFPISSGKSRIRMIVALYSTTPVQWNLENNVGNKLRRILFLVSNGSRVISSDGEPRLKTRIAKSLDEFTRRTIKKYRALTSFIKIPQPYSKIDFNSGDLPEQRCDEKNLKNPIIKASFDERVAVDGCFLISKSRNSRKMHVVHLKNEKESTLRKIDVIFGTNEFASKVLDVIVVFKSDRPVFWNVNTSNLQGFLQIVSDSAMKINNKSKDLVLVAKEEQLPRDPLSFVELAKSWNSSLTSFSQFSDANTIKVALQASDRVAKSIRSQKVDLMSMNKRERPPFFNLVENSKKFETSTSSHIPPPFNQLEDPFPPKSAVTKKFHSIKVQNDAESSGTILMKPGASALSIALMRSFVIICSPSKVVITFNRNNMALVEGLVSLSLDDRKCGSRENVTYVTLEMDIYNCGSEILYQNKYIIVQNRIHFVKKFDENHPSNNFLKQDSEVPAPLPFQCRYKVDANEKKASTRIKFDMHLYKDKSFEKEIEGVAHPINIDNESMIYVEISADLKVSYLGVLLKKCWVSTSSNKAMNDSSSVHLIDDSCPVSDHSKYLNPDDGSNLPLQRFAFKVPKKFLHSFLFVHCNLSLCHHESHPRLLQCIDTKNLCGKKQRPPQGDKYVVLSHKSAGPLRILGNKEAHITSNQAWVDEVMKMTEPKEDIETQKIETNEISEKQTSNPDDKVIDLTTEAIVGIAFSAFVIGALFMGIIWFIHVRTDPRRNTRNNDEVVSVQMQSSGYNLCPQTAINSGNTTPNSDS